MAAPTVIAAAASEKRAFDFPVVGVKRTTVKTRKNRVTTTEACFQVRAWELVPLTVAAGIAYWIFGGMQIPGFGSLSNGGGILDAVNALTKGKPLPPPSKTVPYSGAGPAGQFAPWLTPNAWGMLPSMLGALKP